MSLSKQLDDLTTRLRALVLPSDCAIEAIKTPEFVLNDGDGMPWQSRELLRNGPLVVIFYRGRWSAYCNAQLAALQQVHHRIATAGASLPAYLSPD
ncbi:MAG: redoxin domain-containing protein [Candidatus Angelobacter sp.]